MAHEHPTLWPLAVPGTVPRYSGKLPARVPLQYDVVIMLLPGPKYVLVFVTT